LTFLTPLGAFAALACLLPLAAWYVGRRRADAVGAALGLRPPRRRLALDPLVAAAAIAVLGLAAAQPALTHTSHARERTGVQALFVVDTSRSMAAAATPGSPTRLDRAVAAAVRLRSAIADVPAGIATLTDRVLPDLLPVPDAASFDGVAERGVQIESPPPAGTAVRATTFSALSQVAAGNYFASKASRRLVVLLTDGESDPVDTTELARALPAARGYRFVAVRFWRAGENVYDADGRAETAYRPDPLGRVVLGDLAEALGGHAFEEAQLERAASALRDDVGSGPTERTSATTSARTPLAPYLAALALLLLAVAVLPLRTVGRAVQSAVT
jgi:hypothetical protein